MGPATGSRRVWTMVFLLHQVTSSLAVNRTAEDTKPTERPQTHKINNGNPYEGLPPVQPGKGWQSIIFEPLQNVQMSRSKFQVASFIDFQPYLSYFDNYGEYLNKFLETVAKIPHSTLYKAFIKDIGGSFNGNDTHEPSCDTAPQCNQAETIRQFAFGPWGTHHLLHEYPAAMCRNRHTQACLVQQQLVRLQNTMEQLRNSYQRVKYRFLATIDFVKETTMEDTPDRKRRSTIYTSTTQTGNPSVHVRWKRLIDLLAGIGVIVNSIQIKWVKQSINRLQEQNILQDQKIDELARYLNLTTNRVKLHDEQIYSLQVEMVRLSSGLRGLIAIANYRSYTYYLMNMAQLTVFRLMVGLSNLEKNIDRIDEYLRVMTTHKATPIVIPPNALRSLLEKVMTQLRPNPRLRLPYDPSGRDIWKYYDNIQIYPVLSDNMLVVLLTIPLLDTTLELNIYRIHSLPAIPPGHHLAAVYQLEGEYFAVGKHGSYVALPDREAIICCINTRLAVCQLDRALYSVNVVQWCVYALYIQDKDRIRRDCRYNITKVEQNLAKSLGVTCGPLVQLLLKHCNSDACWKQA